MGVVLGGVVNDANRNNELDADEAGVPGVEVQLLAGPDTTTQEDTETNQAAANVTDANGTYIFTDLTPGEYYLQFVLPPGYEFTSPAEGSDLDPQTGRTTAVVISSEEALAVINVGIAESSNLSSNSTIGDFVWNDTNGDGIQDDGEGGIADAAVELYYANETLANSTTTDADGIYTFGNLSAGEYYLVFTPPEGYNLTTANQGTDDALDSDADPLTGTTEIVTLAENETQLDWDAGANVTAAGGAEENATIGDFVWNDTNGDGLQSEGEPGVPGVTVRLLDENGDPVTDVTGAAVETVTGEDGHYALQGVVGTTYIVEVVPPDGLTFVTPDAGDDTLDSDVLVETGRTEPFTLAGEDLTRDAGLNATVTEVEAAVVGGYAWSDTDANGVRDASEIGMPGVVVTLLGADGTDAGMTTTDDAGAYRFIGVAAGTYSLSFSPPEGYTFSPAGQDSTADPASGTTEQFELGPGEEQTDWNVGLVPPIAEETQTPEEEVTPEDEMTSEEEVTPEEETAGGSIL